MSVASAIRRMIEAGLTAEQAILAAEIMEQESAMSSGLPVDKRAEKIREYDRNRKADQRLKEKMSSGLPVESSGSPILHIENTLPIEIRDKTIYAPQADVQRTSADKRRGCRLPSDWQPKESDIQEFVRRGFPRERIDLEVPRFRDWALSAPGSKGVKLDWDAAWRNWLRTAFERWLTTQNRPGVSNANRSANDIKSAFAEIRAGISGQPNPSPDFSGPELDLVAS